MKLTMRERDTIIAALATLATLPPEERTAMHKHGTEGKGPAEMDIIISFDEIEALGIRMADDSEFACDDSARESILHSIYVEMLGMGFDTDESIDGGDFVEWGGQVFNDIREAFERDGVPVPTPAPRYQVICAVHGKQELTEEQYDKELEAPDTSWACPIEGCKALCVWDDSSTETAS